MRPNQTRVVTKAFSHLIDQSKPKGQSYYSQKANYPLRFPLNVIATNTKKPNYREGSVQDPFLREEAYLTKGTKQGIY